MKKLNIILEGVSLEIPPLRKDSEGYLRGGFVGIGGNDIAIGAQYRNGTCENRNCTGSKGSNNTCTNNDCTGSFTNNTCTNNYCDTVGMSNATCENPYCDETTTETTNIANFNLSISGLLI